MAVRLLRRHAIALITKPNVYVDTSELALMFSPSEFARILRPWLEVMPEHVVFGTDADFFSPGMGWQETTWLGSRNARRALATRADGNGEGERDFYSTRQGNRRARPARKCMAPLPPRPKSVSIRRHVARTSRVDCREVQALGRREGFHNRKHERRLRYRRYHDFGEPLGLDPSLVRGSNSAVSGLENQV
jgi:hypothetical protein